MGCPTAAAAVIPPTMPPPGAASRNWAEPSRCQLVLVVEIHTTGPPAAVRPAARNPVAVRRSTVTWSPAWTGAIPVTERRVQVVPTLLVQTLSGPIATQCPDPPAISVAGWPGAGWPPPAACSPPGPQPGPPSPDTRNGPGATGPPDCEPVTTTRLP